MSASHTVSNFVSLSTPFAVRHQRSNLWYPPTKALHSSRSPGQEEKNS
jgi:hypothetical protein